ncbi:hypothetical protein RvY_04339-2 [Ramazzottius varieornatus]|uniref:Uncharacterized protein n=1 Tax=Ramazzottius varieornatus TaxID=947166 RepID=A0A1D1US06_RAMVA|nr:hypothetical protein RvY_04339-2 [Ramazzottius varieornatus]
MSDAVGIFPRKPDIGKVATLRWLELNDRTDKSLSFVYVALTSISASSSFKNGKIRSCPRNQRNNCASSTLRGRLTAPFNGGQSSGLLLPIWIHSRLSGYSRSGVPKIQVLWICPLRQERRRGRSHCTDQRCQYRRQENPNELGFQTRTHPSSVP